MTAYQDVFERYEKKYLLDKQQYTALLSRLGERMEMDQYGKHTICNLYYDTPDFTIIRASLQKPIYKEKLRLRSYGIPHSDGNAFLELKKKYKGVVYKRRTQVMLEQKEEMAYIWQQTASSPQIQHEINWFVDRYHPTPKMYIAYDRIALSGREDPQLRLTFDNNIRWRTDALKLSAGDYGAHLQNENSWLMEIKIARSMPIWLSRILSEYGVFPVSMSKYGACYQRYMQQQKGEAISA